MPRLRRSNSTAYTASPAPTQAQTPSSSRTSATGTTTPLQNLPLPAYQTPSYPLTADARNSISLLLNQYPSQKLHTQLKNASDGLTNYVDEVNQLVREGNEAYQRRAAKRTREGEAVDDEDSAKLQCLREKVHNMTERMETSVRKCIDGQKKVANVDKSLREIQGNAQKAATQATQATNTVTEDGEENGDDGTQRPEAFMTSFDEKLERYTEAYLAKPPKLRYQEHDWFRNFKQTAYTAINGDEARRQDPSSWFDDDGGPRPGETGGTEEDFEEVGERISTKCPLTLRDFVEPVTSKKCPHSFEKSEVVAMIRNVRPPTRGRDPQWVQNISCPISGCQSRLSLNDLVDDIRLKTLVKRKQRREELARQQAEEDEDENRRQTRGGTHVEEIESDEGELDAQVERSTLSSGMAPQIKQERLRRATQEAISDDDGA